MSITITDSAKDKITSTLKKLGEPSFFLRVALKGGGCSGFMYHYEFVKTPAEKDKVFTFDNVRICIDIKSYLFLNGSEIDYEEDIFKSGFVFKSPNAKRKCGCGESVSF